MSDTLDENTAPQAFDLHNEIPNFAIDASTNEALCFAENLLICAANELTTDTKPIGGYCITVEKFGPNSREYLVNVAASMSIESSFAGGSKLIGSVTENFQCLEEKRNEFLYRADGTYEKCLFIGSSDDSYHIRAQTNCPCDCSSHSDDFPFKSHTKLLSEAGNIVLMRYLALTNFHGSFSLESLTIDGIIENCDYKCNSAEWKRLDGRRLEIYTVERKNRNKECTSHNRESKTLLTRDGKIVRHDWLKNPFLLRINPLIDPRIIDKNAGILRKPLRDVWPDDFELLSKYLDKKSCTVVQHSNYISDHPEIKKLVADYTQALLIVKPVDVIGFTIQHFRSFAVNPESLGDNSSSSDN